MPQYVRKVDIRKWLPDRDISLDWLDTDDVEADAVSDLRTRDNTLSIFEIENETMAKRAIATVSAGSTSHNYIGYIMFDDDFLNRLTIEIDDEKGHTNDTEVDLWHRNIINLSGKKLVQLGIALKQQDNFQFLLPDELIDILCHSIQQGFLKRKNIKIANKTYQRRLDECADEN